VLTSDHAEFGAAEGPLEEGNLGVVVGVDHLPDTQQGLTAPRYCVRACHNGLLHRCGSIKTQQGLHVLLASIDHSVNVTSVSNEIHGGIHASHSPTITCLDISSPQHALTLSNHGLKRVGPLIQCRICSTC
jgi:hypothetical protein